MTTASTAKQVPFAHYRYLHRLCFVFLVIWIVSAIHPIMFADWLLENLLVFAFVGFLALTYRWLPYSELSYTLIFVYLCMHEWGAHHKYANVPIGEWMRISFHSLRNNYDRVVHFAFGLFLAYPEREMLMRKANLKGFWTLLIPVIFSLGLGAAYEILEAVAAGLSSPDVADAFLGLQGDPWDTHKDMFMGFAGSVVSMGITGIVVFWRDRKHRRAREAVAVMAQR